MAFLFCYKKIGYGALHVRKLTRTHHFLMNGFGLGVARAA